MMTHLMMKPLLMTSFSMVSLPRGRTLSFGKRRSISGICTDTTYRHLEWRAYSKRWTLTRRRSIIASREINRRVKWVPPLILRTVSLSCIIHFEISISILRRLEKRCLIRVEKTLRKQRKWLSLSWKKPSPAKLTLCSRNPIQFKKCTANAKIRIKLTLRKAGL